MGEHIRTDEIVLLLDHYGTESKDLHESLKRAGYDCPAIVIEEDGFLPEGVSSVYGYFLGAFEKSAQIPGKPRYFNQIKVPKYWEISGNNSSGKIQDKSKERGRIFYAEPGHKRLVRVVDWLDERGIVRASDHYNRWGALYARTIFNAKGQKVNKTFFDAKGKEVIMENYVTGDIILNDGKEVFFFRTKTDFVLYFMKKSGYAQRRVFFNSLSTPFFVSQRLDKSQKKDILFWQEPKREDIPGNMQIIFDGTDTRTGKIFVQNKAAYDGFAALGVKDARLQKLGYIYAFEKENEGKAQALICTNSDQIEHCKKLVSSLPQMHFHIAAITEMSSRLMSMDSFENVTLYPGVKLSVLDELFAKCDYYFDINHQNEIVSAVRRAFLHNQLIFAFAETLHNGNYVAKEHIYPSAEVDRMIAEVKDVLEQDELRRLHISMQQRAALAEDVMAYQNL